MIALVRSLGLFAGCALCFTCSLYDESLLSLESGASGVGTTAGDSAGAAPSGGVSAGKAGASMVSGGVAGTAEPASGGGSGGSGVDVNAAGEGADVGGAPSVLCQDHPVPGKSGWTATASHSSLGQPAEEYFNPPEFVHDRTDKRWATGKPQSGDEWLQVDFGARASVSQLWFTLRPDDHDDYARIYTIRISDTPLDFAGPVVMTGGGIKGPEQLVELPKLVTGRYLLLTQEGKTVENWWSISELTAECID